MIQNSQHRFRATEKILLFIFAAVFAIWGLNYYQSSVKNRQNVPQKNAAAPKSIVNQRIIDDKIETPYAELSFSQEETALMLLKKTATVKTRGEGENAYVVEINNRLADEKKKEFWAFYVNGKMAEVGAGSYKLKKGDKIEWKIQSY